MRRTALEFGQVDRLGDWHPLRLAHSVPEETLRWYKILGLMNFLNCSYRFGEYIFVEVLMLVMLSSVRCSSCCTPYRAQP